MQKNGQGGVLYLCYILTKTHIHGARLVQLLLGHVYKATSSSLLKLAPHVATITKTRLYKYIENFTYKN